ncbi:vomeronasal type-2 receptor 26-like [Lissotriton helveticus]
MSWLKKILWMLPSDTQRSVVNALVASQLDYGNILYLGANKAVIRRLQLVQNAAARLLSGCRRTDHITGRLPDLHWLRVDSRVKFKALSYMHKIRRKQAPYYLQTLVPSSFCSESCPPGFRQAARKGQPICCFDCVPCPAGEISNKTDSADCWPCPEDHWPNERQTQCFSTTLQFLSFGEPLGTALSFLTSLLFIMTLFVLCAFRKYQDTPIIKANNRVLSYVLLVAIMLCFLSSFTFISYPSMVTCMLRQNSFGISFAISISTVLAKTITVIIAFNARDPTSRSSRWIGTRVPSGVVLLCSFPPVLICTVWLILDPPFPVKIQIRDTTILQCDEGSVLFFYLMLGYLGLLASVSFVVAFHARNLPQSFNEANLLTFSMLVFLAVWISFIPAYLSTQGKYMVAVEIFAILSSAAGLLGCIFIPKCYIILWRPDLNTKQYLMQKNSSSHNQ